jgi:hypothetical protein
MDIRQRHEAAIRAAIKATRKMNEATLGAVTGKESREQAWACWRAMVETAPSNECPFPILGDRSEAECIANGHCGCGASGAKA